jgi:hypothetical protein
MTAAEKTRSKNLRPQDVALIAEVKQMRAKVDKYLSTLESEIEALEAEHDEKILNDEDGEIGGHYCELYRRMETASEHQDNISDFLAAFYPETAEPYPRLRRFFTSRKTAPSAPCAAAPLRRDRCPIPATP